MTRGSTRIHNGLVTTRNIIEPLDLTVDKEDLNIADDFITTYYSKAAVNMNSLKIAMTTHDLDVLLLFLSWINDYNVIETTNEGTIHEYYGRFIQEHKSCTGQIMTEDILTVSTKSRGSMNVAIEGVELKIKDDIFKTNLDMIHFKIYPMSLNKYTVFNQIGIKNFNLTLDLHFWNYIVKAREPILERLDISIAQTIKEPANVSKLNVNLTNENFTLNFSNELLQTIQSITLSRQVRSKHRSLKYFIATILQEERNLSFNHGEPGHTDCRASLEDTENPFTRQEKFSKFDPRTQLLFHRDETSECTQKISKLTAQYILNMNHLNLTLDQKPTSDDNP